MSEQRAAIESIELFCDCGQREEEPKECGGSSLRVRPAGNGWARIDLGRPEGRESIFLAPDSLHRLAATIQPTEPTEAEIIEEAIGEYTFGPNEYRQNIVLRVDAHPKLAAFIADYIAARKVK